jgi:spermidine synthase
VADDPLRSEAPLGRAELFGTVFVTGTAVMLIEILGTRIIGPVFGVSLFVWSALLAVTLGSLAIGYYAGGTLVDRRPTPSLLGAIVLSAGVLLGLVPAFEHGVLAMAESLGPRGGPLVSAALLFAASLLVLGMVGPVGVRLATHDLRATGHRVGAVYGISTVGSLLGTILTAFVLIPNFETDHILLGAAVSLILLGGASLALRGRRVALVAALVPVLASTATKPLLPRGIELLDRSQSLYGLVEVIDDHNRGVRLLRSDHSILGAQFLRDHSAGFAFLHLMEAVQFARPRARSMLQIGLGIGSLPSSLQEGGPSVDVVEIDPAIVRFARRYFGFSTRGETFVEDARTFLRRTERRYDLVVHDTFTGGTTPEHLLSLEVIERIHQVLGPGGLLALNFVGYEDGPNAEAALSVARTIRAVFPNVRTFRDSAPGERPGEPTNLIFFASDAAVEFRMPDHFHFENDVCERVLRSFPKWEVLRAVPDGDRITDARNPLARLQLPVAEEHFRAMNELLSPEVWLH